MRTILVKSLGIAVVVAGVALGTAYAQQEHDHSAPAAPAAKMAGAEHAPEIFCGTMKTGQLCSMGTTTLLGLTPEKREAWLAAVRQYNNAVNVAIVALQAQAKSNLNAAQTAEVDRWFAIGINPQINQLLGVSGKAGGAK